MNGGPGCSSLEGFLQETGYINWGWGQYAPEINAYGWPTLSNVLWVSARPDAVRWTFWTFVDLATKVEQPVGTGFSIGTPNATNEEDIASDFVKFFKNFEVRALRRLSNDFSWQSS